VLQPAVRDYLARTLDSDGQRLFSAFTAAAAAANADAQ